MWWITQQCNSLEFKKDNKEENIQIKNNNKICTCKYIQNIKNNNFILKNACTNGNSGINEKWSRTIWTEVWN